MSEAKKQTVKMSELTFNTHLLTFLWKKKYEFPEIMSQKKTDFKLLFWGGGLRQDNEDLEFSLALDPFNGMKVSLNLLC